MFSRLAIQVPRYCEFGRAELVCNLYSTQRPQKRVLVLWDGLAPAPSSVTLFPLPTGMSFADYSVAGIIRERVFNYACEGKNQLGGQIMLYWALMFLVVALIAGLLGFTGVAVAAAGISKVLFVVFLVLFLVSLVAHLGSGRRSLN